MKYLYIHGANATGTSFNYIREHVGGSDIVLEYNSSNGFKTNLESMILQLANERDLFVIAHSLGGIYALYLLDRLPKTVQAAVTLATPYGGSSIAGFASMMLPHSRLLRDIVPTSDVIRGVNDIPITKPWWQVVTTQGNVPWLRSPNDGVITQDSMRSKSGIEIVEMDTNHYEVVLDPRTVDLIKTYSNETGV